jgi:hypothetical protein
VTGLEHRWRHRGPTAAALLIGLVAGVGLGAVATDRAGEEEHARSTARPTAATASPSPSVATPATTPSDVPADVERPAARERVPRAIAAPPPSELLPRRPAVVRMTRDVDAQRLRRTVTTLAAFGTRNSLSSTTDPRRGIGAARAWVYDELSRIAAGTGGRMSVDRQSHTRSIAGRSVEIVNVVATLRGRRQGAAAQTYLVTAHLDSRCSESTNAGCDAPGANDDASGVAAVVEAARVLSRATFDADLVFLAVSGEEQGLLGAEHFAEEARNGGLPLAGVLNLDVIGNVDGGSGLTAPDRVRVFSEGVPSDESSDETARRRAVGGENDGPSRQLARYVNTVAATYTPDLTAWMVNRLDRFGRGGDHRPFVQRGFPAVRLTEPFENYEQQHQTVRTEDGVDYGDLVRFVDFDYLQRVTRLVVASLASLADAPAVPRDVRVLVDSGSRYDTTVRWETVPGPDVAGYEVVWRDTTSPVWTDAQPVRGGRSRATVRDLPKDNVMVGVRAVDAQGNRSPVALAR